MKRKITSITAAVMAAAAVGVTASADYYLAADKSGSDVKVEVIADKATLPAMEFTVALPSGVTAKNVTTASGAYYNKDNGVFAWAGTEAPADGTVMFSAEFAADNGDFTVTPAVGFSADLPVILKATIKDGTVTIVEIPKPSEDDSDNSDVSKPEDNTSDTSKPSDGTSDVSTPDDTSSDTSDSSGDSGNSSTSDTSETSKPTEPSGSTDSTASDDKTSDSTSSGDKTPSDSKDDEENPKTGVVASVGAIAGAAFLTAFANRKKIK